MTCLYMLVVAFDSGLGTSLYECLLRLDVSSRSSVCRVNTAANCAFVLVLRYTAASISYLFQGPLRLLLVSSSSVIVCALDELFSVCFIKDNR